MVNRSSVRALKLKKREQKHQATNLSLSLSLICLNDCSCRGFELVRESSSKAEVFERALTD
uniref:Uncharacterized protein n=1 Tax=Nelumbo nucifera TaxID=4432 RepID=A0A822XIM8_NELNU|nr:TPA_asm: hypothetical protein HUJ06_021550 [Nelumbo nucifera]